MQLKTYLTNNKIRQNKASIELGLKGGRLSRILSGEEKPTLQQVCKIYDWSKGEVTYWDWVEMHNLRESK